jgi:hypothetical protein
MPMTCSKALGVALLALLLTSQVQAACESPNSWRTISKPRGIAVWTGPPKLYQGQRLYGIQKLKRAGSDFFFKPNEVAAYHWKRVDCAKGLISPAVITQIVSKSGQTDTQQLNVSQVTLQKPAPTTVPYLEMLGICKFSPQ